MERVLVWVYAPCAEATPGLIVAAFYGSMAELGDAPITNGDPTTGIVNVPGRRLAVLKLADGTLLGLAQDMPVAW